MSFVRLGPVMAATFVLLTGLLSLWAQAETAVIVVPDDYASIQAAIDGASSGDTIMVRPGVYNESLTLNKAITLTAELYDAANPANNGTVIDGGGAAAVISIPAGVTPLPVIRGFSIRNGEDGIAPYSPFVVEYGYFSGASDLIDYEEGSGGITRYNVFFDARDDALDLDNQTEALLIEDNRLLYSGQDGIEIRLQDGSAPAALIDITIRDNVIAGSGEDGIQFIDYPDDPQDTNRRFIIHNNLFANNMMAGVGLMADTNTNEDYSGADIVEVIWVYNNTFYGNEYGLSGGDNLVSFNNIIVESGTYGVSRVRGGAADDAVVAYTLFYNNGAGSSGADATESQLGAGNVFGQDPLLAGPPGPGVDGQMGTVDDDFSGLILTSDSPASDAGVRQYVTAGDQPVPGSPIDSFVGAAPDLGWQEGVPELDARAWLPVVWR